MIALGLGCEALWKTDHWIWTRNSLCKFASPGSESISLFLVLAWAWLLRLVQHQKNFASAVHRICYRTPVVVRNVFISFKKENLGVQADWDWFSGFRMNSSLLEHLCDREFYGSSVMGLRGIWLFQMFSLGWNGWLSFCHLHIWYLR